MWPDRIFSGIQPTGTLHIGNYFGAVKNWVNLQDTCGNVMCCVADLHSMTLPHASNYSIVVYRLNIKFPMFLK